MLNNTKKNIERVAIEMFGKIDIEKLNTYTENHANSWFGDETTIDVEFNELVCSIRNTLTFTKNPDATATGILNGCTVLISYALALYYKSDEFNNSINALEDCINVIKTIDSNLELIENIVWGYKTHTELIDEINKEKSSLIEQMNFGNESLKTTNNIIDSLFC